MKNIVLALIIVCSFLTSKVSKAQVAVDTSALDKPEDGGGGKGDGKGDDGGGSGKGGKGGDDGGKEDGHAAPEPATWVLILGGVAFVAYLSRRNAALKA